MIGVKKTLYSLLLMLLFSTNLQAVELEVTALIGKNFSPELINDDYSAELSTTNEPNFALAFAWQDSPTGQGQILVNYISRDFTDTIDNTTHSFDTVYTHFSGVSLFKEREYVTTLGLGIGTTYFHSDFDSAIYPSITLAVGTRYNYSANLVFITELRGYATLTDDDDTLFCQADGCVAQFDRAVWIDHQISIGLAYRF
ncbi:hypothetical protein L3081_10780 [Colwellia sp. MSW7]|uniref:Outer membrane protein beta-barrel domain-containing protein n=1 Tax=Colwellia maritima TaxID=2912588 RepID=A0ABS9X0P4_9GAMM|nr:hypothetical protein [Colwellia maritima]MCI2283793.1 hypothetical protein [Colwellia maritima]